MKKTVAYQLSLLVLILAVLSCRLPWEAETTPVGVTATGILEEPPTEVETEAPIEAPASNLPEASDFQIYRLAMFTPSEGWAVTQDGNHVLITQDGGETWLDATPPGLLPLPEERSSLSLFPFFLDEDAAWVTPFNTGVLYHTRDGGLTWFTTDLPFDSARYFFLNLFEGFALVDLGAAAGSQYVALYSTEDGGVTWEEVFSHVPGESQSLPESGTKNGITFLDELHGWIGGSIPTEEYFYFYSTSDGGMTWTLETDLVLPPAYGGSFLDVWQPFFVNDRVGYLPVHVMAWEGTMYILLYSSDDGGESWTYRNTFMDGNAVDFFSSDEGWAAAGERLFQTADGGVSWRQAGEGLPNDEIVLAVDFVDARNGWVITTPDESTLVPLKLYRTTDGGVNWMQLLP